METHQSNDGYAGGSGSGSAGGSGNNDCTGYGDDFFLDRGICGFGRGFGTGYEAEIGSSFGRRAGTWVIGSGHACGAGFSDCDGSG